MDWRFSTFLLFMFVLLLGITWSTSETGLCNSDYVIGVMKENGKDGALNCFEFWFNRYQSLLGTTLAIAVALIALMPARGQLREMAKQTAAISGASLAEKARALEIEARHASESLRIRHQIKRHIRQYEEENYHNIYQEWPKDWSSAGRSLADIKEQLELIADQSFGSAKLSLTRRDTIDAISGFLGDMAQFSAAFRTKIGKIDYEFGETDLSDPEIAQIEGCIRLSHKETFDAIDRHLLLLKEEIRSKWQEVARNEQIATS